MPFTTDRQQMYDRHVARFMTNSPELFLRDGTPNRGNTVRGMFWWGFNLPNRQVDRRLITYPAWAAGRDMRRWIERLNRRN
jgi:hypothetical protein